MAASGELSSTVGVHAVATTPRPGSSACRTARVTVFVWTSARFAAEGTFTILNPQRSMVS